MKFPVIRSSHNFERDILHASSGFTVIKARKNTFAKRKSCTGRIEVKVRSDIVSIFYHFFLIKFSFHTPDIASAIELLSLQPMSKTV